MRIPTVLRRYPVRLMACWRRGGRLESVLGGVRDAAQATLDALKGLSPETVQVEFGIKLAGEAGASDREGERRGPLHGNAVVVPRR